MYNCLEHTKVLALALSYTSKRLPLIPVLPIAVRVPCGRLISIEPVGQISIEEATTDAARIVQWWLQFKDAMIGLPTGLESGITAIQISGAEGMHTLEQWMDRHDWFPETLSLSVGNDRTLLFCHPGTILTADALLGPGVTACKDGTVVILPPSVDVHGNYCNWDDPDDPIVDMPIWLARLIEAPEEVAA